MDASVSKSDPVGMETPAGRFSALVSRPRLLRALDQAEAGRLTLIVAPAGYGKTTLVTEWLVAGASAQHERSLCYTLSEMDNDQAHFLRGLAAGVQALLSDNRPAVDASSPLSYSLALLFQQAARAGGGRWRLVLDDCHLITAPAVHQALDTVLEHPAWPVHLVIASRSQPPLSAIARLRVEGWLFELDEADLRFTLDETQSFLASGGLTVEQAALHQIVARTEGWPAALELVRQAARREPHADLGAILGSIGDERPLFDYLAGQVLDRQPVAIQEFLRRTSLLPYLSVAVCNAYLRSVNSAGVLNALERQHLFLFRLTDRPGRVYRYHALFQGFLQQCLEQVEGFTAVEEWHRRVAACLLEPGGSVPVDDQATAVEHLLAAREWKAAADAIEGLAQGLDFGALPRLEPWFERLPAKVVAGRPRLLLALGRMRERQGRWPEALATLQQAERAALAAGSADDLGGALQWQAWVHFRQNRYPDAIDLCQRALAILSQEPEGSTEADRTRKLAAIHNTLAGCYVDAGNLPIGRQYALRALEAYRSLGDREREAVVLHNMATYTLPQGLLRETIETERTSLRILEELNSYRVCFPLVTLGQTHLLRGEWEAARAVLERLLRLTDAHQDAPRRAFALYLLGHLQREQGELAGARRYYQEAWEVAEQIQDRFLLFELHQGWAHLALAEGDRREARRQGQAALDRSREPPDRQLEGQALATLAMISQASGDTPQAEAHYRRALEIADSTGGFLAQATLRLDLADLCRREGRDEEACRHLGRALALSSEHNYAFLFTRKPLQSIPLLVLALGRSSDAVETSEVSRLLAQIGQEAVEPLLALLASAGGQVEVQRRVVGLLAEIADERAGPAVISLRRDRRLKEAAEAALARMAAAPRPPLRIQVLGGFRALRGDLPIPPEAWQRRKARLLLLYLLAQSPRRVPADELIEVLWPDLPPDSAAMVLNTTFSDLRRILEPYLGKGQPSRYLVRDKETLAFDPTAETWYDVAAFEQAVRAGGQAARQALELYRGDFLPEEPYVDWVLRERERLRGLYLNTLMAWLAEQVQAGAWREGAELARHILDREAWLEEVWRALMTCLARLGRRSEALQAYQACARALYDQLDAAPSAETQALYESLREGPSVSRPPEP